MKIEKAIEEIDVIIGKLYYKTPCPKGVEKFNEFETACNILKVARNMLANIDEKELEVVE